jgi:hypothetical protein
MKKLVIEPSAFKVNLDASRSHNQGLIASVEGQYVDAEEAFSASLAILDSGPKSNDSMLQKSRVMRDKAFNIVREAVAVGDARRLYKAQDELDDSLLLTDISDEAYQVESAFREVLSERAATIGMMGRVATAQMVLTGELTGVEKYYQAHDYNVNGANGYYRVSNAVNAARHERIADNKLKVARWMGKAIIGMAWTAVHDPKRLRQATLTSIDRTLSIRTVRSARASVLKRP